MQSPGEALTSFAQQTSTVSRVFARSGLPLGPTRNGPALASESGMSGTLQRDVCYTMDNSLLVSVGTPFVVTVGFFMALGKFVK
mmetsp:Transcript_23705/g.55277  ORF Transcript_23705/g.55277 Transcript_23705/m.55277 type:complete len:84 (+) Transcript_23705:101-352(+)|eukprot:CAMPEP_0178451988 /NCGR_PEP_ID=MMETSP0689_2-20121128/43988_1 /TAXON_ID=160604 /ORGANISM="Amphidinium massartii, Strain CS-259" /LENGTH=83 /DNA_ID=CAMNT_0020077631 /DNA_START=98 /DNA_END=349 /DNA_ORIENTATION=+